MSSFGSLNIAYTGLNAHQKRMNIIGENIANVNTEGYHRQRVELSPIDTMARGLVAGVARISGGVEINDIARLRDKTLSDHARVQRGISEARSKRAETLQQLEQVVGGLNPGGLHDQMTSLFNSFDDLAAAPNDPAMRQVTLQRAESVAEGFTRTSIAIDQIRDRTLASAQDNVQQINSLTTQIATIDAEILGAYSIDADPNALMDKRDLLVTNLAAMAAVDITDTSEGQVSISLDGQLLVSNGKARHLTIELQPDATLGQLGYDRVVLLSPTGRELNVKGGELAADLDALAVTIPDGRRDLDAVAAELANQVNAAHRNGVGLDGSSGNDLFQLGPASGELTVSADVAGQPDKLGAAAAGAGQFDNENARLMAQLADDAAGPLIAFVESVGSLAVRVSAANGSADAARAASAQADSLALSAGGVSLDEELTDLITAQRSYEASARLLTSMDEMLQTLINTGRVGR
jgi:flagellar hook-associated protein 1 FlgK